MARDVPVTVFYAVTGTSRAIILSCIGLYYERLYTLSL